MSAKRNAVEIEKLPVGRDVERGLDVASSSWGPRFEMGQSRAKPKPALGVERDTCRPTKKNWVGRAPWRPDHRPTHAASNQPQPTLIPARATPTHGAPKRWLAASSSPRPSSSQLPATHPNVSHSDHESKLQQAPTEPVHHLTPGARPIPTRRKPTPDTFQRRN